MDVKTIADGLWDAVTLGLVASVVTTFSMWVKEFLARVRAWWEMRRNPTPSPAPGCTSGAMPPTAGYRACAVRTWAGPHRPAG